VSVIFRDAERGDKVSRAHCRKLRDADASWRVTDLTDFGVGAWEPSFDTELWRTQHRLHLYVQHVAQGDGERVTQLSAQPVYVLRVK
jgi:hypothetical protein